MLAICECCDAVALLCFAAWCLREPKEFTYDILRQINIQSPRLLAIFAPLYLLYVVLNAFVGVVVGYGLWHLKEWARIIMVVLVGIEILRNLVSMFVKLSQGPQYGMLFYSAIEGLILAYLFQTNVKNAFAKVPASAMTIDAVDGA